MQQSENFASSLVDAGLNQNDIVLLFGLNSFQYLISWFGIVWTGLVFSPVTPAHGQFELTEQIKDSKASVLILDYCLLPVLNAALENEKYSANILNYIKLIIVMNCNDKTASIKANITMKTFEQMINNNCNPMEQVPHFPVTLNDKFMIVYTSGSTGLPKGAIHTNYSWIYSLFCTQFAPYHLSAFILWHPFGHISGTWAVMASFLTNDSIILFKIGNLDQLLQCIGKYKLDWIAIGQTHVNKLIEIDYPNKYDLSTLKYVWLAGSKASQNEIKLIKTKYNVKFVEFYSSTEFMCGLRIYDWEYGSANIGNIGRPLPGVEAKIVDLNTGQNLPANQQGEVCLRGPNIFAGYLGNEQATRSTIDNDGWYHSGDVGYYDDTGAFYIVDRIKAMIKFRSWTIFPTEIEHVIGQHPAVENVCVVGIKHIEDGYHLRAYVQTKTGKQVEKAEIINLVHGKETIKAPLSSFSAI